jgi:REP element-mobilizing transposase RayT
MSEQKDAHPKRKRPAHWPVVESENRSIIVFLTICSKDRQPILACEDAMLNLMKVWRASDHWAVGRFTIMPDHIHLFCSPGISPVRPLKTWIGHWRSQVARSWRTVEDKPLWQREYWDRQLWSGDSYSEKWHYVRNNPVRQGLVENADDWPYQGEIQELQWHD